MVFGRPFDVSSADCNPNFFSVGWYALATGGLGVVATDMVITVCGRELAFCKFAVDLNDTRSCHLWIIETFFESGSFVTLVILVTGVALFYERITNSWRVDVLDVGHGLAVLIEKHGKVTLYDTGKAWNSGSIAQQVISPVLHRRGFGTIDMFIISHADSDHAGGRQYIEQHFSPAQKFSSQNYANYQSCIAGERWYWQALYFEVLWPPKQVNRAYNPHSCVVRVVDKESDFKLLLTGDIEASVSGYLCVNPTS